jgi:hypothetical protein
LVPDLVVRRLKEKFKFPVTKKKEIGWDDWFKFGMRIEKQNDELKYRLRNTKPQNGSKKIEVFGRRARVKMPVSSNGYVIGR